MSSEDQFQVYLTELVLCSVAYAELYTDLVVLAQASGGSDQLSPGFESGLLRVQDKAVTLENMVERMLKHKTAAPQVDSSQTEEFQLRREVAPLLVAIGLSCLAVVNIRDRDGVSDVVGSASLLDPNELQRVLANAQVEKYLEPRDYGGKDHGGG